MGQTLSRRDFLKIGAASAGALAVGQVLALVALVGFGVPAHAQYRGQAREEVRVTVG